MHGDGAPRWRGALSSSPVHKSSSRTLRGGLASHRPVSRGSARPVRGGMTGASSMRRGRQSIAKAGRVVRATWKPSASRGGLASPSTSSRALTSPLDRHSSDVTTGLSPQPLPVTPKRREDFLIDLTCASDPPRPPYQRSAGPRGPPSPQPCTIVASQRPCVSSPVKQATAVEATSEPSVVRPSVKASSPKRPFIVDEPASTDTRAIISAKERMEVLRASLEAATAKANKGKPLIQSGPDACIQEVERDKPPPSEQRDPDTEDSPPPRQANDTALEDELPELSSSERASLAASVLSFISCELKAAARSRMYLCR